MKVSKILIMSVLALAVFAALFSTFNTFYVTNEFSFNLLDERSVVQFTVRQFDIDPSFAEHHVVKVETLSFFQGLSNILYFVMQLAFCLLFLGAIYIIAVVAFVGVYEWMQKRTGNNVTFYALIFSALFAAIYIFGFWSTLDYGLYYPFLFMVAIIFSPLFLLLEFFILLFQDAGFTYYLLWIALFASPFLLLYVMEYGFDFSRSTSGGARHTFMGKRYADLNEKERSELAGMVGQSMISMYGTNVYRPKRGSAYMTAPDGTLFTQEQWDNEITRVRRDHGVSEG